MGVDKLFDTGKLFIFDVPKCSHLLNGEFVLGKSFELLVVLFSFKKVRQLDF